MMVVGAWRTSPACWAALTAAGAALSYALARPRLCSEVALCQENHAAIPAMYCGYLACGLFLVLLHEVVSLGATYRGVRDTKALVPTMSNRCLPSLLHITMFAVLVAEYALVSLEPTAWYAHETNGIPGMASQPVYTITYVEWLMTVPVLLVLAGYCALERPLEEMARPVLLTNAYIMTSWIACVSANEPLRWALVIGAFGAYYLVSKDMVNWVEAYYRTVPADFPSLHLRPWLAIGLILDFSVYAVVYLAALTGRIPVASERMYYSYLNVGTKITFSIMFVAIRGEEYHRTLTRVLRTVSTSNAGMISIMRGSFDVLLPVTVDAKGECNLPNTHVADMFRLQGMLCRPVTGLSVNELLADECEREHFATYVRNTLAQAKAPQAFSKATLSTQGRWMCGDEGQMPPVAQVLNCRIVSSAAEQGALQASIHLSVVPQTDFTSAERQMVLAVRFAGEDGGVSTRDSIADAGAAPCFDEFDVNTKPDYDFDIAEAAAAKPGPGAIMATLRDLSKLGISKVLQSEDGGSESGYGDGSSQASTYHHPLSVASDEASHFGAFVKPAAPKMEDKVKRQLVGSWRGTVSEVLGGYTQTITFLPGLSGVNVEISGKTMSGDCRIGWQHNPVQLDIRIRYADGSAAPPIPYIIQLAEGDRLQLCGPSSGDMQRPKSFEGPGMCFMRKVKFSELYEMAQNVHVPAKAQKDVHIEPEKPPVRGTPAAHETDELQKDCLSRQTTEEDRQTTYSRQTTEEPEQEMFDSKGRRPTASSVVSVGLVSTAAPRSSAASTSASTSNNSDGTAHPKATSKFLSTASNASATSTMASMGGAFAQPEKPGAADEGKTSKLPPSPSASPKKRSVSKTTVEISLGQLGLVAGTAVGTAALLRLLQGR